MTQKQVVVSKEVKRTLELLKIDNDEFTSVNDVIVYLLANQKK